MEFDEHEEQEEEIGMHQMQAGNYQTLGNSAGRGGGGGGGEGVSAATTARKSGGGGGSMATTSTTTSYRFRECLKNHAVAIGGHAVDGCGEFMAAGEEGTLESLKCAACNCHRNFHRKETEGEGFHQPHPTPHHPHHHHPHHAHHQFSPAYPFRSPHPSGYLHVTPPSHHHHQRPLPLPSTSREDEDASNPSSSGGGGGAGSGGAGGSKKRFRTKFTQDQKEKMLAFAERLGWRIQKQDEALVQQFCADTNVKRHVLKVWMHNNKHTLGIDGRGSLDEESVWEQRGNMLDTVRWRCWRKTSLAKKLSEKKYQEDEANVALFCSGRNMWALDLSNAINPRQT